MVQFRRDREQEVPPEAPADDSDAGSAEGGIAVVVPEAERLIQCELTRTFSGVDASTLGDVAEATARIVRDAVGDDGVIDWDLIDERVPDTINTLCEAGARLEMEYPS